MKTDIATFLNNYKKIETNLHNFGKELLAVNIR